MLHFKACTQPLWWSVWRIQGSQLLQPRSSSFWMLMTCCTLHIQSWILKMLGANFWIHVSHFLIVCLLIFVLSKIFIINYKSTKYKFWGFGTIFIPNNLWTVNNKQVIIYKVQFRPRLLYHSHWWFLSSN